MRQRNSYLYFLSVATMLGLMLFPQVGYCSVESSLAAIQMKLVSTILPLAAVLGLLFAGLSYVMGSPNARSYLILAIIGAGVGFGVQSIVALIRSLVN